MYDFRRINTKYLSISVKSIPICMFLNDSDQYQIDAATSLPVNKTNPATVTTVTALIEFVNAPGNKQTKKEKEKNQSYKHLNSKYQKSSDMLIV